MYYKPDLKHYYYYYFRICSNKYYCLLQKKKKVCENLQNERNSQDESKMTLVLEMSSGN